jgi:hypothetical protein
MRLPPVCTVDLFPELQAHLVGLLRSLSPDDWHRPTMCSAWQVKDFVAHLVDTNLRRLSLHRNGYASPHLRPDVGGLLPFLNRLNAEWTVAAYRLSPPVLINLLEESGHEMAAFFGTLDPVGPAPFPVAWAGEGGVPELVRRRPRVHREVAPRPAALRGGRANQPAAVPQALPPRSGDVPAGPAVHLPGRGPARGHRRAGGRGGRGRGCPSGGLPKRSTRRSPASGWMGMPT